MFASVGFVEVGAGFAADGPADTGHGHEIAFVGGVDEDFGAVGAVGGMEDGEAGVFEGDGGERTGGEGEDAGFFEHLAGDAHGDVGFVGPVGVVFDADLVGEGDAAGGVVGFDAGVPLVEEAHDGGADGLIGVAEAEASGVDAADVVGGFEEGDGGAFTGGGDGGAEACGGGAVDDDVGDEFGGLRGAAEEQS